MKKNGLIFASLFLSLILLSGCNKSDDGITEPVTNFKLDGVWQAYNFDSSYPFTSFLAQLRTAGTEVKGSVQSDCFGIFNVSGIPFTISDGSLTESDISVTFVMESTKIIGHLWGNVKENPNVTGGTEIVAFIKFEYSGTLTQTYPVHLVKQSITYLPKISGQ
jgi:hypothetical protein